MDHQPRSGGSAKKSRRDRLIALAPAPPAWGRGLADEGWWSRLAQPSRPAWAAGDHPLRRLEQTVAHDDPDPQAWACYGRVRRRAGPDEALWRRLVEKRPVSALTPPFLDWCGGQVEARGVPVGGG